MFFRFHFVQKKVEFGIGYKNIYEKYKKFNRKPLNISSPSVIVAIVNEIETEISAAVIFSPVKNGPTIK